MLFCRYKIRVNARDFYETWFWNTEVVFVSGVGTITYIVYFPVKYTAHSVMQELRSGNCSTNGAMSVTTA
jgi:hypothetical protein